MVKSLVQALFGLLFVSVGLGVYYVFKSEVSANPALEIMLWFPYTFIIVGGLIFLGAFYTAIKSRFVKRNYLSLNQAIEAHRDEIELDSQRVVYDEKLDTYLIEGEYLDKNHITYLYRFGYTLEEEELRNLASATDKQHIVIDYTDPQNCKMVDADKFQCIIMSRQQSLGPVLGILVAAIFGGFLLWLSYGISRFEGYSQSGLDVSDYGEVSYTVAAIGALVLLVTIFSAIKKSRKELRYAKSSRDLKISKVEIYPEIIQYGGYPLTVVEVEYDGDEGRLLCRTQPMHQSVLSKLNYQGSLRGKVYLNDNQCVLS